MATNTGKDYRKGSVKNRIQKAIDLIGQAINE